MSSTKQPQLKPPSIIDPILASQRIDYFTKTKKAALDDIIGKQRGRKLEKARQHVMYVLSKRGNSSAWIGRQLNRHHSTILWGIAAHKRRVIEEGAKPSVIAAEYGFCRNYLYPWLQKFATGGDVLIAGVRLAGYMRGEIDPETGVFSRPVGQEIQ